MYSKMNVGKNILVGVHFDYYGQRKLEKAMEKELKRKRGINQHIIYENNGNQEKGKVKGHKFHVRRKMKENNGNEDIRDLIDKKASDDQLESFFQFSF